MSRVGNKPQEKVSPILDALQSWQQTVDQSGVLMDREMPFYSEDGQFHSMDAGWINQNAWDKRIKASTNGYPYLCPDFIVKITEAKEPDFSQDKLEFLSLRDQGCQLGWLIEPYGEYVYVFQPGYPVHQIPTFDYYINGREVLEGFEFPLKCLRY